ncbi:MAG: S1C family serine protease [Clostridia bacterium]|jgi:serine protease Do
MKKSKKIIESDTVRESSDNEMKKSNGYYMETIKSQKKSFLSRILVPLFISILCLTLSISACVLTIYYVNKIKQIDIELPFVNILTQTPGPSSTITPIPSHTQGSNNNSYSENENNTESVTTTYKNITKIEVIPFEVNSSISDAVENILPSLAYLRCRYTDMEGTYMSEATALIISEDGYMVTADTVIDHLCYEKSSELKEYSYIEVCVNFDYNNLYFARVVGRDKINNIALLKIDADEALQFIEYGDSDKLLLGETVIAAASGNNSVKGQVTAGIIGGLMYTFNDRIIFSNESVKDNLYMINATAFMTASNNGGALVNKEGQVIALTVYLKDNNQDGFYKAIPINKIKEITENLELKSYSEEMIPNLGIAVSNEKASIKITSDDQQQMIDIEGVRVKYIGYGTPAFYSGLKIDDIVVSVNDQMISSPENFFEIKNNYLPGENIVLSVYRYNELTDDYMTLNLIIMQDKVK